MATIQKVGSGTMTLKIVSHLLDLDIPKTYQSRPNDITREVIALVDKYFPNHFADLDPFYFAVTREHTKEALDQFIKERFISFGDYQDAMIESEPWTHHSHLCTWHLLA